MEPDGKKDKKENRADESPVPANEGIDIPGKAHPPDADRTEPGSLATPLEDADQPFEEASFRKEHKISRDHAEPTDVTDTTNDNEIDSEYIDLGGGD